MNLRKLELKDAPFMLEWMHDDTVVHDLRTDFAKKTIDDCESFITSSWDESESFHLAIVDSCDEYMGTVSLKHIKEHTAEFGITVRKCAMGKGYSHYGMERIISLGHQEHGISLVYWCVDPANKRAVRFYDKNGYHRCDVPHQAQGYSEEEKQAFVWYCVDFTAMACDE